MNSFDRNDPSIIWIAEKSTGPQYGTYTAPFVDISLALKKVRPGYTIVFKEGTYSGDVNFEISGTPHKPIRITVDIDAEVIISKSCWFLYDTSDVIISGFTFRKTPRGAIAVIGKCERNRFEYLHFQNCSIAPRTSCTLFFGGSGGNCNIVEYCVFERTADTVNTDGSLEKASIGLMISEGDREGEGCIKNHIIRKNSFTNYNFAILVGARSAVGEAFGHTIEYNLCRNCYDDGIRVKCGDTIVRGNILSRNTNSAISVLAGRGSIVQNNRVSDGGAGVTVNGVGHTVQNNCIIRCRKAIYLQGPSPSGSSVSENIVVEQNTCIDCGITDSGAQSSPRIAGIHIDAKTSSIIQGNLFHGPGHPYYFTENGQNEETIEQQTHGRRASHFITDNISSGACRDMEGSVQTEVAFKDVHADNFENASGYGAHGWILTPERLDPDNEKDIELYRQHLVHEKPGESVPLGSKHRIHLLRQSLFFGDRGDEEPSVPQ
jgi:parallel beta-helix repeat protein